MESLRVELFDLPDEIFLMIFKKLENVEVLCSLMNINMRLNQIVSDPIFTTRITLMKESSSMELISPLPDIVLDRFCARILAKIHDNIKWLKLETLSMERILLAANNYSNLRQSDIFIMNKETNMHLFTDKSPLVNIFQTQIVILSINCKEDMLLNHSEISRPGNIFMNMLIMCDKLRHFKFYTSVPHGCGYISFGIQSPTFSSSNLVELHMTVYRFDECLFLLDGRLSQLHTLIVTTFHILPLQRTNISKERLPNLKDFSLTCISDTYLYDEVIVTHLRRMINLEKLALHFVSIWRETFTDGNNLNNSVISYIPHLNQFIFNIRSMGQLSELIHLPLNEDIQLTFTSFKDYQVITCVDYFPKEEYGQCHIYSCPYTLTHYDNITNNFPGGLFNNVREIKVFDERPFEHEFFIQISQSFPFLKELVILNSQPQQFKQEQESNNDNRKFLIIEYSHLIELRFIRVHDDYVEQFLFETKTCLSNYIRLSIDYDQLQRVTHNFTRHATRGNCSRIKRLSFYCYTQLPEYYEAYFPHLE